MALYRPPAPAEQPRRRTADAVEGAWTVLSAETRIRGEIRGRHPVRIDGTFDGIVEIEGLLHIGPTAVVTGEFTAAHIILEGKVEGSLAATGTVEFRATANMHGDTRAGRVAVEERALVNGRIEMTEGAPPTRFAERRSG
jgi:cytoskeletal protein CcmA (bactofilin family)